jgi:hypothetical protein
VFQFDRNNTGQMSGYLLVTIYRSIEEVFGEKT